MRGLFPGFYERTEEELSMLWGKATFVFDTNMLLHVYRYSPDTRERFFETLSRLKERIWIPYQVAYEYQDRRVAVISEQIRAYDVVAKLLDTVQQSLRRGLEPYKRRHAFIDPVKLTEEITKAVSDAKSSVQKAKSEHPKYKEADPLRERIDELLNGSVGRPYTKDELEEKYQEAELRLERQIPPGLEDADKKCLKKYGDVILWFQLIDYACAQKQPIIFITDDVKKDWWLTGEESQGPIRPRPELVQEIYAEANVPFYMYQGYSFMEKAQQFLKLEEKPEVIEEIKEVRQQDEEDYQRQQVEVTPKQTQFFFHCSRCGRNSMISAEYSQVTGEAREQIPTNVTCPYCNSISTLTIPDTWISFSVTKINPINFPSG